MTWPAAEARGKGDDPASAFTVQPVGSETATMRVCVGAPLWWMRSPPCRSQPRGERTHTVSDRGVGSVEDALRCVVLVGGSQADVGLEVLQVDSHG